MKLTHNFLMNKADESNTGAGGSAAPDVAKLLETGLKNLQDQMKALSTKVDQKAAPAPAPKAKVVEAEDDVDFILDPKAAKQRLKQEVLEETQVAIQKESAAQSKFNSKFNEMLGDFPEIANTTSPLHIRAKEIMAEENPGPWDTGALERAVLRAAAEKGVLSVKHRGNSKVNEDDSEDAGGYLGGSGSGSSESRRDSRRNKSDKLPAATLAFAELCELNVKDPKVVERLTKTHNDRKGNWNRYR